MKDDGVQAGYLWLVNHVIKHWETLSERVERESREQMEQEKEMMRQRYERFRNNGTLSADDLESGDISSIDKSIGRTQVDQKTNQSLQNGIKNTSRSRVNVRNRNPASTRLASQNKKEISSEISNQTTGEAPRRRVLVRKRNTNKVAPVAQ